LELAAPAARQAAARDWKIGAMNIKNTHPSKFQEPTAGKSLLRISILNTLFRRMVFHNFN
jgi:hypothetical protein